jgi:undecaprenyl diphosphate synthase
MAEELLDAIRLHGTIPRHIAVIMDGNGRWARARHLPRQLGHREGMKAVRECVEGAAEAGVELLTLFAFSEENWRRPGEEIDALMRLLEEYAASERSELARQGARVHVLGELARLSEGARRAIDELTAATAAGERIIVNLCISYGSRAEIARAARLLALEVAQGRRRPDEIDEETMASYLYTARSPDPDLLIRTSGEQRLSNFLLWQLAYTELHMTPVLWPAFTRRHLFEAIREYQRRERRFGKVTA